MSYMPVGGYREGTSPLHRADALCKLLGMLLVLAAVILTDTLIGYLLIGLVLLVSIQIAGIGLRHALRAVWHMRLFFLMIFLMNAFFHENGEALWSWWVLRLSCEGMVFGTHVAVRVALAILLGQLLCAVTSPLALIDALESLLYPLQYLRIPVQDIALILGAAMQFIPIFSEEAEMIRRAQTARGARFDSKNLTERANSLLPLAVPIFLSAFRRADDLSVAMEARGYHRRAGRIPRKKRKLTSVSVALMLICILLFAVSLFCKIF